MTTVYRWCFIHFLHIKVGIKIFDEADVANVGTKDLDSFGEIPFMFILLF